MTMLNTAALPTRKRYKIAREVAGLSQGELASMIGVNRTTIGDWEAGRTEPAFSKMVALAHATNQALDWFAEGLDAEDVRPKGLEPPTFCSVVGRLLLRQALCLVYLDRQVTPDSEIATLAGVA